MVKARKLLKVLLIFPILLFLTMILIYLLSPWLLLKSGAGWLEKHKLELSDNSLVRLNLFNSTISVKNFNLNKHGEPELQIKHAKLHYQLSSVFKRSFIIKKLEIQSANLSLAIQNKDIFIAGFSLSEEASPKSIETGTDKKYPIQLYLKELALEQSTISLLQEGKLKKILFKKLVLQNVELSPQKVHAELDLFATLSNGSIDIKMSYQSDNQSQRISLNLIADRIELSDFDTWIPLENDQKNQLIDLSFQAKSAYNNQKYDLKFSNLKFNLSKPDSTPQAHLFEVAEINFTAINVKNETLTVDKIDFSNPVFRLHFDSSQTESQDPRPIESKLYDQARGKPPTKNDSKRVKINSLVFSKPGKIQLRDENPDNPFEQELQVKALEINKIDSNPAAPPMSFLIDGGGDNYLNFNLKGHAQPFSDKLKLTAQGVINELDLPPLNYYNHSLLGFGIERGQLDTKINLDISENILVGKLTLKLKGAKFSSNKKTENKEPLKQSTIPLNVALDYLKDQEDNIKLDIPLSGNVNDPNFGKQDLIGLVVRKAAISQSRSYLINTFLPYSNVITVGLIASENILKIRFKDLEFAETQTSISEEQKSYMDELAQLIKDKKDLRINACSISTINEARDEKVRSKLAKQRAKAFKQYLVEDKFVNSARILLCEPKSDIRTDTRPRIEITE